MSQVTHSAVIGIDRVASSLTPLPLRYGGRRKRQKPSPELLPPAEAHVCSFLLFRNDLAHLKTTGAEDNLIRPNTGETPTVPRNREPSAAVELGGKWSSGPLEALSLLPMS